MWRTKAVVAMLLEEVGGLPSDDPEGLARALRRSRILVAVEWVAIIVLIVMRDRDLLMLTLDATEQTVFTVGILAVAAHSGFKLGQVERLGRVLRLSEDLKQREGKG